jgi:hypothetical protein
MRTFLSAIFILFFNGLVKGQSDTIYLHVDDSAYFETRIYEPFPNEPKHKLGFPYNNARSYNIELNDKESKFTGRVMFTYSTWLPVDSIYSPDFDVFTIRKEEFFNKTVYGSSVLAQLSEDDVIEIFSLDDRVFYIYDAFAEHPKDSIILVKGRLFYSAKE